MTNFKNLCITIFILPLFVSCGGGQKENIETNKQETPKALQDDKLEIRSYRGLNDLTEVLYQELADKNTALKKLDDDIEALRSKPNDLNEKFHQYDSKSNSYYASANYKASAIADSLLKKKIIALIGTSNNTYKTKTLELNSLLKQISKNGTTLTDHYSVLKIILTLPLIEKYQDENKPNKKEFKDLINQQEKIIFQIDSLTTKF